MLAVIFCFFLLSLIVFFYVIYLFSEPTSYKPGGLIGKTEGLKFVVIRYIIFFFQFSLFSLIDNVREYIYIRELNCLYLLPSFFGTEFNRKRLSLDKRDHFFFRISFLLNDDRVFLLKFFLFVLLNYLLITIIFSTYSTQHSAYSTNNTTYPANNTTILFVITDQTLLIL